MIHRSPASGNSGDRSRSRISLSGISARLYLLVGLTLALMAGTVAFGLFQQHERTMSERKAMLQAMTESALSVLGAYHKMEQDGSLSREEAQAQAKL